MDLERALDMCALEIVESTDGVRDFRLPDRGPLLQTLDRGDVGLFLLKTQGPPMYYVSPDCSTERARYAYINTYHSLRTIGCLHFPDPLGAGFTADMNSSVETSREVSKRMMVVTVWQALQSEQDGPRGWPLYGMRSKIWRFQ